MKKSQLLIAALLAVGSVGANAAGFYAEIRLSSVDGSSTVTPSIPVTSTSNHDAAFDIGIGYKANDMFGLEAGYTNVGSGSSTSTYTAAVLARNAGDVVRSDADVSAFYFGGNLTFALTDKIDAIARAGIANWEADYTSATINGASVSVPGVDGSDPYYGLGIVYKLNDKMSLSLDYRRSELSYTKNGYKSERKLDITSVGLRYNF